MGFQLSMIKYIEIISIHAQFEIRAFVLIIRLVVQWMIATKVTPYYPRVAIFCHIMRTTNLISNKTIHKNNSILYCKNVYHYI